MLSSSSSLPLPPPPPPLPSSFSTPPNPQQLDVQGVFQQLHAFKQELHDTSPLASDLQTPDPLNIIHVALARQRAAVQAGCAAHPCPDNSNLVNTLYQRHQALLEQQQQQQREQHALPAEFEWTDRSQDAQRIQHGAVQVDTSLHALHQQPDRDASGSATEQQQQSEQLASAGASQVGQVPAAEAGQITSAHVDVVDSHSPSFASADVMVSGSPTFQGDMVPDTPIAAAEAAVQEAAPEAAEDASKGVGQQGGTEGADTDGIDLVFELESGVVDKESSTAVAAAAADTPAGSSSGLVIAQHQVWHLKADRLNCQGLMMY